MGNTLHHHIISNFFTYDDQLPAIYVIMMNSSTDKDSTTKFSPKHLPRQTVLHVGHRSYWQISQDTASNIVARLDNTVGAAESVLSVAATGHDKMLFLKAISVFFSLLGYITVEEILTLRVTRDLDLGITIGTSLEMDRKLAHKLSLQVLWRSVSISAAIRLFNRSVVEKHPLDVVSYTVAVKGLVRGRRMDEACSLLYKMKGLIGLLSLVCARREIRIG
uniref:Pentatricopeptide repeat-containing protein n=2 Tax=Brassica oleracea TaxID=3712 RepID=A0A0D3DWX9_BRAOL